MGMSITPAANLRIDWRNFNKPRIIQPPQNAGESSLCNLGGNIL